MANFIQRIRNRINARRSIGAAVRPGAVGTSRQPGAFAGVMAMSAINRCVRLISESIAAMPLRVMERDCDGVYKEHACALTELLSVSPNAQFNAFEFWRNVVRRMLLDGALLIIEEGDKENPAALQMVNAACYSPNWHAGTFTIARNDAFQRLERRVLPCGDVANLRGYSEDDYLGRPVAAYAAPAAEFSQTADAEAQRRVESGTRPRYIVKENTALYGGPTNSESNLETFVRELGYRLETMANVIGISGEVELTQIAAAPADAQFQSIREFAIREVCRFFGVPPTFVFCDGGSNYKSTDAANTDFLVNALEPLMRNIELELTRKFVPARKRGQWRIQFDREARMTADMTTRADYYTKMLACGAYTPNDIRRRAGQSPVDGGDTPLVSANLRPLETPTDNELEEYE